MARPRRSAHPDANQPGIIADLRRLGFLVANVSAYLPTPDIFVFGWDIDGPACWTAWEIKTETGKPTPAQQEFMDRWPGAIRVARSVDDILSAYGRIKGE